MARPPVAYGPPKPPRLQIESITLDDFRAFGSGPTVVPFAQGNKRDCNLLLYGENGAGKSSLFEALRGLFAPRPKSQLFKRERYVFSQRPESEASVEVRFNDNKDPALWTVARHPGRGNQADPRVVLTARRAAMLDYRALLDTGYGQGKNKPNLFTIAMDTLLHDYPLASGRLLSEVWREVQKSKPHSRYASQAGVEAACASFNAEFSAALTALLPFAREVLSDLLGDAVTLDNLVHGTVHYVNAHEDAVLPIVRYRTHPDPLSRPQFFLNEARQSALALAIYLGSRLSARLHATNADHRAKALGPRRSLDRARSIQPAARA